MKKEDLLNRYREKVMILNYELVDFLITDIWKKDLEDYWIEIVNEHLCSIWDMYRWIDDIIYAIEYEISESVFYEYYDWISLGYESEDYKKYKEFLKKIWSDGHLLMFYRYKFNK